MLSKRTGLALAISGWALMTLFGHKRKQARREAKSARKEVMQVWEGEGGNLPPAHTDPRTTVTPAATH